MVLDAVARIEETLAAQKKPARDPGLDEALAAIRAALDAAKIAASAALGDLALEENLAPVRKGARVIREIAWRLREIGADGRICDLIDSQVSAIEGACGRVAGIDPAIALSAAFDLIEGRIAAFDDGDGPPPAAEPAEEAVASSPQAAEVPSPARVAEEVTSPPARAAPDGAITGRVETAQAAGAAGAAETAMDSPAMPAEPVDAMVEPAEVTPESVDAFDATDEAVLDMVALEMAAPDADEAYDPPEQETSEIDAAEDLLAAEPIIVAEKPDPVAASAVQPSPEPSVALALEPSLEPSLGSSLIANGIVQRPRASKPDPLAPIRRMSQTEKIAFFS
jgi:hypothetical protein